MTSANPATAAPPSDVSASIERACSRIAPTWPLDRFIAVNPWWGSVDRPFPEVAARLAALTGSRLLMPRAWYREQWDANRLRPEHVQRAIEECGSRRTVAQLVATLSADTPTPPRRPLVVDVADLARDPIHEMSWREFVTHGIGQICAAYFASSTAGDGDGLWTHFRRRAEVDRSPELLMGMANYRHQVHRLPLDARECIETTLLELGIPASEHETYLSMLLLDIGGWAAWCAYLRWTSKQVGGTDESIVDLLAMRCAWELLLHRDGGTRSASRWRLAVAGWAGVDHAAAAAIADDWVLQQAMEVAYQQELARRLTRQSSAVDESPPVLQVAFCIDVRSERFRRALEAESGAIRTIGFAGFFGLPIEYHAVGAAAGRPQLPGLLAPRLRAIDASCGPRTAARRKARLAFDATWARFRGSPASGFSFVESVGFGYAIRLVGHAFGLTRPVPSPDRAGLSRDEHAARKPRLGEGIDGEPLDRWARIDLAESILRGMSMTREFGRLIVVLGHGSQTTNNPHAAGLDCGACCGQTGEVNARVAAALLNELQVRAGLAARGISIPSTSHFIAGLHNTTTDEVVLFDEDEVPAELRADLLTLRHYLREAGCRARAERAPDLDLGGFGRASLLAAVRGRARDWSQVRPEWGLANNAAFIVAPRARTRGIDLEGRVFLHEYQWRDDSGFRVLEQIMTAPMLVAHWINFQYYASTVDNLRYGSGNKLLHNVVGGHIGVCEGNGGDLRIGLPLQSLHDGQQWMHTPLRLSVYIEAPRAAITRVLENHLVVRQLVEGEWLRLFQIDDQGICRYVHGDGAWEAVATDVSP